MKLVSYIAEWHKIWSLRFSILSAAFGAITATYITLPADWLPAIPNWLKLSCAVGTFISPISSAISSVIKQSNLGDTK